VEEFCNPKVSVNGVVTDVTKHINFVPFQIFHLGPYFGIIKTTKLYMGQQTLALSAPSFPCLVLPFILVDPPLPQIGPD
jgi:hypothetical protein